jgi:hypothetical protein
MMSRVVQVDVLALQREHFTQPRPMPQARPAPTVPLCVASRGPYAYRRGERPLTSACGQLPPLVQGAYARLCRGLTPACTGGLRRRPRRHDGRADCTNLRLSESRPGPITAKDEGEPRGRGDSRPPLDEPLNLVANPVGVNTDTLPERR